MVVANIVVGFRVTFRPSKSSVKWKDMSSFALHPYCKDLMAIPDLVDVIVGPFIYPINKVIVNFSTPHEPNFSDHSSSNNHGDLGDGDYEF